MCMPQLAVAWRPWLPPPLPLSPPPPPPQAQDFMGCFVAAGPGPALPGPDSLSTWALVLGEASVYKAGVYKRSSESDFN